MTISKNPINTSHGRGLVINHDKMDHHKRMIIDFVKTYIKYYVTHAYNTRPSDATYYDKLHLQEWMINDMLDTISDDSEKNRWKRAYLYLYRDKMSVKTYDALYKMSEWIGLSCSVNDEISLDDVKELLVLAKVLHPEYDLGVEFDEIFIEKSIAYHRMECIGYHDFKYMPSMRHIS